MTITADTAPQRRNQITVTADRTSHGRNQTTVTADIHTLLATTGAPQWRNQVTTTAKIHPPHATSTLPWGDITGPPTGKPPPSARIDSCNMTETSGDRSPDLLIEEDTPPLIDLNVELPSSREQRTPCPARSGPGLQQPPAAPRPHAKPLNTTPPAASTPPQAGDSPVDLTLEKTPSHPEGPHINPRVSNPPGLTWTTSRVTRASQRQLDFEKDKSSSITPQIPTRRATRHINMTNKAKEWSLTVRKKWLILGDSNLSRFPPFQIPDLQVDSFPGDTFRHCELILSKISQPVPTETVVLAFGLNSRNLKPQTSIKQMQRDMKVTKLKFPCAKILVPAINFSRPLPHQV